MTELLQHIWGSIKGKLALIFIMSTIVLGLGVDMIAYQGGMIPFGPTAVTASARSYQPPGYTEIDDSGRQVTHLLGTDEIGRDVASRLLHGINTALIVGFGSTAISVLIALLLGCFAGYYGDDELSVSPIALGISIPLLMVGFSYSHQLAFRYDTNQVLYFDTWRFGMLVFVAGSLVIVVSYFVSRFISGRIRFPLDSIVMRFLEIFKAVPALFLLLSIYAIVTRPSLWLVVVLIGLLRWPSLTRLVRAEVLKTRQDSYVHNARFLGMSAPIIVLRHILPNVLGPIIVAICFSISTAILIESTLSFLQIGLPITEISWGQMLSQSRNYFNAWWLAIPPGLMIFAMILSFNLLGQQVEAYLAQKKR